MVDYSTLPQYMQESVRGYVELGRPIGDFLTAVFSNNLVGAYSRADDVNAAAMRTYASFLYNEVPRGCWGSVEAVKRWQSHNGLSGNRT